MSLVREAVLKTTGKEIAQCGDAELYLSLLRLVKEKAAVLPRPKGERRLYYISAEFLLGRLLGNNLINMGLYEAVDAELAAAGRKLSDIEQAEPEPSLGNGGLGRLAACFLESIATLGLPGDGIGLAYHFGLFRQVFQARKQTEEIDPWIQPQSWLTRTGIRFPVRFGGCDVEAELLEIDVIGHGGGTNKLHLFDLATLSEALVQNGITFDKTDAERNLTLFLYPDDSDREGQLLRVYQQYFMVSAAAQLILREMEAEGYAPRTLCEHAVIQINDTHPSMIIPELIRLLMERGMAFGEAADVVGDACAYTNHTILAEALEKWPMAYIEKVAPQLVPIVRQLDARARRISEDPRVAIIDAEERVHMAHMDIHSGFSVNGVAALHTEILKTSELAAFYALYPQKFNNKTNGITFRRWLTHCNPALDGLITTLIGDADKRDAKALEGLLAYREDAAVLDMLAAIKARNKQALRRYVLATQGIELHGEAIFDIQAKRIHEYKRQQLNVLYAIYLYMKIKAGHLPRRPVSILFGGKAAPAYVLAKDIIHVILCLQALIEKDPDASPWLQVVMLENYNVTLAEKLMPACDISEQISLASKEASGTGNMKFMLNGAVTLGTLDGANIEIRDLVGPENIYIFGKTSEEVLELYRTGEYRPAQYYWGDAQIGRLVDFIIGPQMRAVGDIESLLRVHTDLTTKDWFMTLPDLHQYIQVKDQALDAYEERALWNRKALTNIAMAGYFSSDRTIAQYNQDIWRLTPDTGA